MCVSVCVCGQWGGQGVRVGVVVVWGEGVRGVFVCVAGGGGGVGGGGLRS